METEQQRLAEVLPPLGTQLQNAIQEKRQTASDPTAKGLTPPVTAMGGAVRYNSKTAVNDTVSPLSMPGESNNPQSNPLLTLNPAENAPSDVPGLPPLSSAPQAKPATVGPKYQQPSNDASSSDGNSATSYRQRIGREAASSAPDAKRYTVEPGDTYMLISTRFYETSLLYRALAVHNRRLGAAWLPEPGTEIEIPSLEYLQTNYAEILSRSGESNGLPTNGGRRSPSPITPTTGSATTLPNSSGTKYVVQEGDSVFKIAEEKLKDTGRWRDIIQWNSDQLQDARDLRPGMEIILPGTATRLR